MATFPLSDLLTEGTKQLRTEMVKTTSITVTLQNAVSASSPGLDFTVDGYGVATLQITGTFVATITFYGSVDGTNFVNISAYDRNLKTEILSTTNTGIFEVNCRGLKMIRAAVTWTSGTSVTVVGVAEPFVGQNHAMQLTGSLLAGAAIQNVTTAGTRVQLPSIPCREVTIIAKRTNTGYIYAGKNTVSSTVYGVELTAKDSFTFNVSNANEIWIDSSVNGEGISYVAI